jgi:GNAT acetyltransferase-like protein
VKITWTTDDYQIGDEENIIRLYEICFPQGSKSYNQYWQWEFENNPEKVKLIKIARDVSKNIVGHYAVSPRRMYIDGKNCICSLSLDTMTHPDFRKQGMFTRLASELYSDLENKQVDLTFGFPNLNSIRGFESKLDWHIFGEVPLLIMPVSPANLFKFAGVKVPAFMSNITTRLYPLKRGLPYYKIFKGLEFTQVQRFGTEADDLWKIMRSEFKVAVDRGASYLNWRYAEKPGEKYIKLLASKDNGEHVGLLVIKVQDLNGLKLGTIVEVVALPGIFLRTSLISKALTILSQMGAEAAAAFCVPFTPFFIPYLLNFFIPVPSKYNPVKTYWGVRKNTNNFSKELIFDRKNWLISWGDTDVV